MKNTTKPLATAGLFFFLFSCNSNNKTTSKVNQFTDSGKVFSYVNYADEMIVEGYIRDSLESIERESLQKMKN